MVQLQVLLRSIVRGIGETWKILGPERPDRNFWKVTLAENGKGWRFLYNVFTFFGTYGLHVPCNRG